MKNNNYAFLPKYIIESGFKLNNLGLNEIAWRKNEILKMIDFLRESKISILGGDVYKIEDEQIVRTYDSWFINDDNDKDFYQRSLEKAILYIRSYSEKNGDDYIYCLVFKN